MANLDHWVTSLGLNSLCTQPSTKQLLDLDDLEGGGGQDVAKARGSILKTVFMI